jgi:(S)-mandelate dehydrogenase
MLISPTGLNGLLWPHGDVILARVAATHGIPFVLSSASTTSLEDVARTNRGNLWFQLYVVHRQLAEQLVQRALKAGYTTLVLTVDVAVNGYRERDLRNGFRANMRYTPKVLWQGLTHPAWTLKRIRHGASQLANLTQSGNNSHELQAALLSRRMDAAFDWSGLSWLRDQWPHRLLVKGITHPEDAIRCATYGIDGIILSNHGGRQFDACISPMEILSATTAVTKLPIIIDSGFRRGADIAKAIALGARAVGLGRAVLYGLAANGEAGANHALELITREFDLAMAHLGCRSVERLSSASLLDGAENSA